MKSRLFLFYCLLVIFSLFFPKETSALNLNRNLSVGSIGDDVFLLQVFLNTDPDTRVATFGPGSSGQETRYFGELTRLSVVAFQEKYRQDILIPAGLLAGNGFVGPLTRQKMAELGGGVVVNQVQQTSTASDQATLLILNKQLEALQAELEALTNRSVNTSSSEDLNTSQSLDTQTNSFGQSFSDLQSSIQAVPSFSPSSSLSSSLLEPFGGQIIAMIPCLHPFNGFVITLGPPTPGTFVYQVGLSRSYQYGPPIRPGQWLLGMAGPGAACYTRISDGDWRDLLGGGLIIFHGSSL